MPFRPDAWAPSPGAGGGGSAPAAPALSPALASSSPAFAYARAFACACAHAQDGSSPATAPAPERREHEREHDPWRYEHDAASSPFVAPADAQLPPCEMDDGADAEAGALRSPGASTPALSPSESDSASASASLRTSMSASVTTSASASGGQQHGGQQVPTATGTGTAPSARERRSSASSSSSTKAQRRMGAIIRLPPSSPPPPPPLPAPTARQYEPSPRSGSPGYAPHAHLPAARVHARASTNGSASAAALRAFSFLPAMHSSSDGLDGLDPSRGQSQSLRARSISTGGGALHLLPPPPLLPAERRGSAASNTSASAGFSMSPGGGFGHGLSPGSGFSLTYSASRRPSLAPSCMSTASASTATSATSTATAFSRDLERRLSARPSISAHPANVQVPILAGPGHLAAALGFGFGGFGGDDHDDADADAHHEQQQQQLGSPLRFERRRASRSSAAKTNSASSSLSSVVTGSSSSDTSGVGSRCSDALEPTSAAADADASASSSSPRLPPPIPSPQPQLQRQQRVQRVPAPAPALARSPPRAQLPTAQQVPSSLPAGSPPRRALALYGVRWGPAAQAAPPSEPPPRPRRSERERRRISEGPASAHRGRVQTSDEADADADNEGAARSPTEDIAAQRKRWIAKHSNLLALSGSGTGSNSNTPTTAAAESAQAQVASPILLQPRKSSLRPVIDSTTRGASSPSATATTQRGASPPASFSDARRRRQHIPPPLSLGPSLFPQPQPQAPSDVQAQTHGGHGEGLGYSLERAESPFGSNTRFGGSSSQPVPVQTSSSTRFDLSASVASPAAPAPLPPQSLPASASARDSDQPLSPSSRSHARSLSNSNSRDSHGSQPASARSVQAILQKQREAFLLFSETALKHVSGPPAAAPAVPHSAYVPAVAQAPAVEPPHSAPVDAQAHARALKPIQPASDARTSSGSLPLPVEGGPSQVCGRVSSAWLEAVQHAEPPPRLASSPASSAQLPSRPKVHSARPAGGYRSVSESAHSTLFVSRSQDFAFGRRAASGTGSDYHSTKQRLQHHASSPRIADSTDGASVCSGGSGGAFARSTSNVAAIEALIQQLKFPQQEHDGAASIVADDLRDALQGRTVFSS